MSLGEIRKTAKRVLKGNWRIAIFNMIIAMVLSVTINEVVNAVAGTGSAFSGLDVSSPNIANVVGSTNLVLLISVSSLTMVINSLVNTGYEWSILDMVDGAKLTVEELFQTFKKNRVGKVIGVIVLRGLLITAWALLFIIPGIIKAYSYSQALNIVKDKPNTGIMEAMQESRELMKGKKGKFFLLQLYFFLWYLIPFLLFVIFVVMNSGGMIQAMNNPENFGTVVPFLSGLLALMVLGIYTLVITFYIRPYKTTAEKVFYRDLTGIPEQSNLSDNF